MSGSAVSKQKSYNNGSNLLDHKDIQTLANDLNNLVTKEYTRRLSGHQNTKDTPKDHDDEKRDADFVSSFISQEPNTEKRNSFIKRERLNSAFKKYDAKPEEIGLGKGKEGEPSFGANSKNKSGPGTNRNSGDQQDQKLTPEINVDHEKPEQPEIKSLLNESTEKK